jgi:hypothetical protein
MQPFDTPEPQNSPTDKPAIETSSKQHAEKNMQTQIAETTETRTSTGTMPSAPPVMPLYQEIITLDSGCCLRMGLL